MFAVIETGGKQYLVQSGQQLSLEKLPGAAGDTVSFDKVLLVADDEGQNVQIGTPYLDGVTIDADIQDQSRAKKMRVVKFRRKVRFRRAQGHRQHQTNVTIREVK